MPSVLLPSTPTEKFKPPNPAPKQIRPPYHNSPRPGVPGIPKQLPGGPLRGAPILALPSIINRSLTCPMGKTKTVKRGFKCSGKTGATKRVKPCEHGDPKKTTTEEREHIDTIMVNALPGRNATTVDKSAEGADAERKIRGSHKCASSIKIQYVPIARLELNSNDWKFLKDQGLIANFLDDVIRYLEKVCLYRIYRIRKRVKCVCPDGSRCRKTRQNP